MIVISTAIASVNMLDAAIIPITDPAGPAINIPKVPPTNAPKIVPGIALIARINANAITAAGTPTAAIKMFFAIDPIRPKTRCLSCLCVFF